MIQVGVQSNDLPDVLTLLADHYQRINSTWTRLKGLMVYPLIVLFASLLLSILVAVIYGRFINESTANFQELFFASSKMPSPIRLAVNLWLPVAILGLVCAGALLALAVPAWRRAVRWRLPAFKESSLSQLASALGLMLQKGCPLNQALDLLRRLEAGSPAHREIARWQSRLAAGHKNFSDLAAGGKVFPPLFIWLVSGSGEDWISGFKHAAEIYYERARHRTEMLLYAALPVSILALGILILCQVLPALGIDPRHHVTAWRWEVELQAPQKAARVRPLFTFQAVAAANRKS